MSFRLSARCSLSSVEMELRRASAIESTPRTREGSTSALGSGAHSAGDQVERRRLQVVDQLGLGERSVQHPLQRRLLDHRDPSPQVEPHDGRGLVEPHDVGHDHDDGVAGAFEHVSQQIVGSGVAGDRRVARRLLLSEGVAIVLILVGGAMIYYATLAITRNEAVVPHWPVLFAAVLSILAKEALYQATRRVAVRSHSTALYANAWHHRSDALSSVAVLIGYAALYVGFDHGDQVAAMLAAVGIKVNTRPQTSQASADMNVAGEWDMQMDRNQDFLLPFTRCNNLAPLTKTTPNWNREGAEPRVLRDWSRNWPTPPPPTARSRTRPRARDMQDFTRGPDSYGAAWRDPRGRPRERRDDNCLC
mgnify:CR=1 FL=1